MFRYISKKSRYLAIVFGIIVLVGVSVYAIDTWDTGSRVEWSWPWKCVYYNGWSNKMRITKSAWSAIFVPTKTNTEFAAFRAHMPSGVTTWSGIGQCSSVSVSCNEGTITNHDIVYGTPNATCQQHTRDCEWVCWWIDHNCTKTYDDGGCMW